MARRRIQINEKQLRGLPRFIHQEALKAAKAAVRRSAKDAWRVARKHAEVIHWERTYKRGFSLRDANDGKIVIQLFNEAPYAELLEVGAAPHKVSLDGFYRIMRWARTKLVLDERAARAVAMSVVKRIAEVGQPARRIVMLSINETAPKIEGYWKRGLHKQLGSTVPKP